MDSAANLLMLDEGFKQFVYKDTKGIPTIGFGRNLRDKGISKAEAEWLLQNDIRDTYQELLRNIPWICQLNEARQAVLCDLAFNLGIVGFMAFKSFLGFVQRCQWQQAAEDLLKTEVAKQEPLRIARLARILETGQL